MHLFKVIRAFEWWDYKFPPILVAAYLVMIQTQPSFGETIPTLLFAVASLAAGAIYVSILNDLTDIKDDDMAGKTNRMAKYSKPRRILFISLSLLCAAPFCWVLRADTTSLVLYLCSYIAFTFYSLPPFRLKQKGLWGVFADAAGSQLLPTLYVAFLLANCLNYKLPVWQLVAISLWSITFGLRGILWHQFHDLENDIKSGIKTWLQNFPRRNLRLLERSIISVELFGLALMLWSVASYTTHIALGLYMLYVWLHYQTSNIELIIITYSRSSYYIVLNEYYQVFLPVALLLSLAFADNDFTALLLVHVLCFSMGLYRVLKNMYFIHRNRKSALTNFSKQSTTGQFK
jgi:4-hydroxybenzoate polyprenyltransferase